MMDIQSIIKGQNFLIIMYLSLICCVMLEKRHRTIYGAGEKNQTLTHGKRNKYR